MHECVVWKKERRAKHPVQWTKVVATNTGRLVERNAEPSNTMGTQQMQSDQRGYNWSHVAQLPRHLMESVDAESIEFVRLP